MRTPFNTIPLYTREGKYVATIETLPWVSPPEIIFWGMRGFLRDASGKYRECFVWAAHLPQVPDHEVDGLTKMDLPDVDKVLRDIEPLRP